MPPLQRTYYPNCPCCDSCYPDCTPPECIERAEAAPGSVLHFKLTWAVPEAFSGSPDPITFEGDAHWNTDMGDRWSWDHYVLADDGSGNMIAEYVPICEQIPGISYQFDLLALELIPPMCCAVPAPAPCKIAAGYDFVAGHFMRGIGYIGSGGPFASVTVLSYSPLHVIAADTPFCGCYCSPFCGEDDPDEICPGDGWPWSVEFTEVP